MGWGIELAPQARRSLRNKWCYPDVIPYRAAFPQNVVTLVRPASVRIFSFAVVAGSGTSAGVSLEETRFRVSWSSAYPTQGAACKALSTSSSRSTKTCLSRGETRAHSSTVFHGIHLVTHATHGRGVCTFLRVVGVLTYVRITTRISPKKRGTCFCLCTRKAPSNERSSFAINQFGTPKPSPKKMISLVLSTRQCVGARLST